MDLNDSELHDLVRDAIARHTRSEAAAPPARLSFDGRHISHGRFVIAAGDGACLIEPAVRCNHCGYCQSFGH